MSEFFEPHFKISLNPHLLPGNHYQTIQNNKIDIDGVISYF